MKRHTHAVVLLAAIAALTLPAGCADAQGLTATGIAGAAGGVIKQAEGLVATVKQTERGVERQLAHDRVDGAVYTLCESATVGELDRLYAVKPGLKGLRPALCSATPIAD